MARTAATGRTAATNRVAVQDMKASVYNTSGGILVLSNASTAVVGDATHRTYSWGCWVKLSSRNVANTVLWSKANTKYSCQFRVEAGGKIRAAVYDGTVASVAQSSITYVDNKWHSLVGVRSNNTLSLYIDGLLIQTVNGTIGDTNEASNFVMNGNGTNGSMSDTWFTFNALSTQDILNYHLTGIIGYPCLFRLPLQEGAGTTALDTSGNGNHGTITAGTYTADVPTKKRELVGGNMVKNGDFEFAPPFVAATTTAGRWIDGTAAGSTTNNLYRWSASYLVSGANAAFDTAVSKSGNSSMRLSTTDASGHIVISQSLNSGSPSEYEARNILIAVLPNTSYTLTAWVKTNNVATNGVWADIREFSGSRVLGTTTPTSKLSGTNDWTKVTVTVTTAATTRYIGVLLSNTVVGNISDAWFDDIVLTPTTPTTRSAA